MMVKIDEAKVRKYGGRSRKVEVISSVGRAE